MSAGQTRNGGGDLTQAPALQKQKPLQNLNVTSVASDAEVRCIKTLYSRCAPLGITELLVRRAKQETPGVKLALLQIWRVVMTSLKANAQLLEPLWVNADLDPNASITPEDRAKADAAAEEALAPCKICVVDLQTFLNSIVRRAVLAAKPNGDLQLAVELEYNGHHAFVVTKLTAWTRRTKEGEKYVIPPVLQGNLHSIGLEIEADPRDLYVELLRRAGRYDTVVDAYLKPILLQVMEKLKATPQLARCSRDGHVVYIAAELFRTATWYFDAYVGLGRNSLYETLRRHGLLAAPTTVPVDLYDEYGNKVKKRALAFLIDQLSEFIDYDVSSICRAAAGLGDEASEGQQAHLSGGHA